MTGLCDNLSTCFTNFNGILGYMMWQQRALLAFISLVVGVSTYKNLTSEL